MLNYLFYTSAKLHNKLQCFSLKDISLLLFKDNFGGPKVNGVNNEFLEIRTIFDDTIYVNYIFFLAIVPIKLCISSTLCCCIFLESLLILILFLFKLYINIKVYNIKYFVTIYQITAVTSN